MFTANKRTIVSRFSREVVAPKVREMDEAEKMDPAIVKGLFENGVRKSQLLLVTAFNQSHLQLMGIETDPDHGGSGSSFTSAIIAIEELAKIDPSVSVMCDVHNTLVNTIFRTYATKEQQDKFLPQLAESKVCSRSLWFLVMDSLDLSLTRAFLRFHPTFTFHFVLS